MNVVLFGVNLYNLSENTDNPYGKVWNFIPVLQPIVLTSSKCMQKKKTWDLQNKKSLMLLPPSSNKSVVKDY